MFAYIFYGFLLFVTSSIGNFFSTMLGKKPKISEIYQGFSQSEVEGKTSEKLARNMSRVFYPQLIAIVVYLVTYYSYSPYVQALIHVTRLLTLREYYLERFETRHVLQVLHHRSIAYRTIGS